MSMMPPFALEKMIENGSPRKMQFGFQEKQE